MKANAIIFDLDGTICDDSHRQKILIDNAGHLTDIHWHTYHNDCDKDEPFHGICELMQLLWEDNEIILLTGRDNAFRFKTVRWLNKHNLRYDQIYMRPDGHYISSAEFKKTTYENIIKPYYHVKMVFEDRTCVVNMWRSLGLICLQTKEGDY